VAYVVSIDGLVKELQEIEARVAALEGGTGK